MDHTNIGHLPGLHVDLGKLPASMTIHPKTNKSTKRKIEAVTLWFEDSSDTKHKCYRKVDPQNVQVKAMMASYNFAVAIGKVRIRVKQLLDDSYGPERYTNILNPFKPRKLKLEEEKQRKAAYMDSILDKIGIDPIHENVNSRWDYTTYRCGWCKNIDCLKSYTGKQKDYECIVCMKEKSAFVECMDCNHFACTDCYEDYNMKEDQDAFVDFVQHAKG